MFDFLLSGAFVPFTLSLCFLFALMVLELVFAMMGGSLLGGEGEIDLDADLDVDVDFDAPEIDGLSGEIDVDALEAEMSDLAETSGTDTTSGLSGWLGLGRMPTLIWLAALLLGFGVSGLAIQMLLRDLLGTSAPAPVAAVPAAVAGLWFARRFGALFARILPKTETTAMSMRSLGRRRGVITQGTAIRGRPAEVRVTDGHGNVHYLRAEPLRDDAHLEAGTEVLVVRQPRTTEYRLIALSD